MERVYDHRRKTEYRRVGVFLVSDKHIIGPRIYISPNESTIYTEVKRLIENMDYDGLEKYLGIKIGRDPVRITEDEIKITIAKWSKVQPRHYTIKIAGKDITFEHFDMYYAFLPNATIVIQVDEKPELARTIYYQQNNITFTFPKNEIPEPIDRMVAEGQLYEKLFKPLGIPEDATITMERKTYQKFITATIRTKTNNKHVNTQIRMDINDQKVNEIRVLGWPFAEGVYTFTVPIGKEIDLTARSVRNIRKKVTKISKVFGPPRGIKISDDWKIEYDRTFQMLTYRNGDYKITFTRYDGETIFESPGVRKEFTKEDAQPLLQTVFDNPEVIAFF